MLGLLCRRTTRNKMDGDRNDPAYALNLLRLSQQTDWVEGEEKTVPCTQLVFGWLEKVKMRYLDILLAEVFRSFAEAKVITPWKWALTVAVVPIKPWRNDAEKQDCELKALDLMAKRLKRVFGRRCVSVMGDALYACQKGMDACRKNGWHYVFVFKEGRSSAVFKEAQSLMDLDREKWGPMAGNCRDKGRTVVGGVRWANAVPFGGHSVNVVECSQLLASDDAGRYYGQFMTDLDVNDARRAVVIARWGRLRWVIENSFKTQKREGEDGFGLGAHVLQGRAREPRGARADAARAQPLAGVRVRHRQEPLQGREQADAEPVGEEALRGAALLRLQRDGDRHGVPQPRVRTGADDGVSLRGSPGHLR